MDIYTTEGIVLQVLPFQEYDQILTVFSPEDGIMKLIAKRAYQQNKGSAAVSPITQAEFVYTKRKSDLYACRKIDILNQHLPLRQDLRRLEAACEMLQAILATQWPGKPAAELYQLLTIYLEKIPSKADPLTVSASFKLKILRHEGLLKISPYCSRCQQPILEASFSQGELFCRHHLSSEAIMFSPQEIASLEVLTYCRQFSQLEKLPLDPTFASKINQMFIESVNN